MIPIRVLLVDDDDSQYEFACRWPSGPSTPRGRSGYTDDRVVHHGVAESGLPFVQKPFSATMLLTTVREVLKAARRRLMGGSSVAAPSAPEKR